MVAKIGLKVRLQIGHLVCRSGSHQVIRCRTVCGTVCGNLLVLTTVLCNFVGGVKPCVNPILALNLLELCNFVGKATGIPNIRCRSSNWTLQVSFT